MGAQEAVVRRGREEVRGQLKEKKRKVGKTEKWEKVIKGKKR